MKDQQGNEHGNDGKFSAQQLPEGAVGDLPVDPGPWPLGADTIQSLLDLGHLERIEVDTAFVHAQLQEAQDSLGAAEASAAYTPRAAYVLLYDAARLSVEAVLAKQGLRPTRAGGHTVAVDAIIAQTGQAGAIVKPLDRIRKRRVDAEYPYPNTPGITADEVVEDMNKARDIVVAMQKFEPRVGEF